MKTKAEKFPEKNPNPVLSIGKTGTVLYSNKAGESLLREWGVRVGEELPSDLIDFAQRVISRKIPEKMEIKVEQGVYLTIFHPLFEEEYVNIYGFDISDQKELEGKLSIKEKQNDVLHKIGKIALEQESLQTFMDESVKLIANNLELEYCKIMELLPDGKFLLKAGIGWKPEFVGKFVVGGENESLEGFTLLTRMPIIVEDFEIENRFEKQEILKIHGISSGASAVIGSMEKTFGVLVVNSTKKRKFTSDDTDFLTSVAYLVAQVVERKKTEEALRLSCRYNRSLIEASLDPLVTIGHDGKITDVNRATEQVTGYSRTELIGTDFSDYFTETEKASAGYQQVFINGEVRDYPLEIKHKDGHTTPVLYNASIYKNNFGDIIGVFAAARDISELKKAEDELTLASKYNRSLIEASLDPLVTIGPDGKITDLNNSTETVTGYTRDELKGTDFSDYFIEPEKAKEGYQHVFQAGLVRDYPLEIQHKDGHVTPVLYNASVYKDDQGEVIGVFAAARDITERKKAEEALKEAHDNLETKVKDRTAELEEAYKSLRENERRLSEAQKMAHLGNWERNLLTDKLYWSDEMYRIFGLRPQEFEITYHKFFNYIHPDDRDYVESAVKESISGKPFDIDFRIILLGGEERVIRVQAEVVFSEENTPVQIRGTTQDITERNKVEEKIKMLANVVESSEDAIITETLDGIITSWNKGAERVYGYLAAEILGKPVHILAPSHLAEETKNLIEMVKQGGKILQYETLRLRKGGSIINVSMTLSPVFDIYGRLTAISVIYRDISKRKMAEEALANIEIARKKEIHHRIKNNLQVISSLLDLQAEKFRNRELVEDSEVLNAFQESQDRVMSIALIHEELHEGRGNNKLDFSPYLERLANNLFQTYRVGNACTSLNIELEANIFFDMDIAVPLGIIINEIVSNSLKYAFQGKDKGEIQIKLRRDEITEYASEENTSFMQRNHTEVIKCTNYVLSVSDNGVGISEGFNLENTETLGIQLVMILVDQLGGTLELKRDTGTEFLIRFRVAEKENQI